MRKALSVAERLGFIRRRPLPRDLTRRFSRSEDPTQARIRALRRLNEHYGITGRKDWGLLLAICLASDTVGAFHPMRNSPGPRSAVAEAGDLYTVVTAIKAVAEGLPNPIEDQQLWARVAAIASDPVVCSKRRKIKAICEALTRHRPSPWYDKNSETLRSHFNTAKSDTKRVTKTLERMEGDLVESAHEAISPKNWRD